MQTSTKAKAAMGVLGTLTIAGVAAWIYQLANGLGAVSYTHLDVYKRQVVAALVVAVLATMSVHIAQQWEKVVVLRLGKLDRVSGPGLFWTWPVIEQNTMRVDTRVRVTTFGAEETLTADLVPLDVNAVLFWHVWDAKAACTEVGDFTRAVELAAQTALRDAIGRAGAAEVAIRREPVSYTHLDVYKRQGFDDNEDCRPAGGARIRRKAGRS